MRMTVPNLWPEGDRLWHIRGRWSGLLLQLPLSPGQPPLGQPEHCHSVSPGFFPYRSSHGSRAHLA